MLRITIDEIENGYLVTTRAKQGTLKTKPIRRAVSSAARLREIMPMTATEALNRLTDEGVLGELTFDEVWNALAREDDDPEASPPARPLNDHGHLLSITPVFGDDMRCGPPRTIPIPKP